MFTELSDAEINYIIARKRSKRKEIKTSFSVYYSFKDIGATFGDIKKHTLKPWLNVRDHNHYDQKGTMNDPYFLVAL